MMIEVSNYERHIINDNYNGNHARHSTKTEDSEKVST